MTHIAFASLLGREFDDFMFASVGEDRNGKPLSVLSALARSDVDPWQEATELARLPRELAAKRLTALSVLRCHGDVFRFIAQNNRKPVGKVPTSCESSPGGVWETFDALVLHGVAERRRQLAEKLDANDEAGFRHQVGGCEDMKDRQAPLAKKEPPDKGGSGQGLTRPTHHMAPQ